LIRSRGFPGRRPRRPGLRVERPGQNNQRIRLKKKRLPWGLRTCKAARKGTEGEKKQDGQKIQDLEKEAMLLQYSSPYHHSQGGKTDNKRKAEVHWETSHRSGPARKSIEGMREYRSGRRSAGRPTCAREKKLGWRGGLKGQGPRQAQGGWLNLWTHAKRRESKKSLCS